MLLEILEDFYKSVLNDEWDVHAAEDIAQQTLLLALENREELREPGKLRAWLNTIRRREGIRMYRKVQIEEKHNDPILYQKMSDTHETSKTNDPAASAAERDERQKNSKLLKEGYQALPVRLRRVFARHYREGKSVPEIAKELNISIRTVRRRLKQIEKRLSKYMLRMIVAYMSFELNSIDSKAMAAQIFENAMKIHHANLATTTSAAASQSVVTSGAAKSTWASLASALLYLGLAFLSLLSLMLGGQLLGEYVVRNAPTLHARRWLVKRFLYWYGLLLTVPLAHILFGMIVKIGFERPTAFLREHCYPVETIVALGAAGVFLVVTLIAYLAKCSQPESDRDGDFTELRRFVRSGLFVCALLSLLNFTLYGGGIVLSNLHILFHPVVNPVKFGYLIGTLSLLAILLASVFGSFVRCFGRLLPLANDATSLPTGEREASETGTWRGEAFFIAPFAAFPFLADLAHILYRQTHSVYSAVELVVFMVWWGLVLRLNVSDTETRWPRIVVSFAVQVVLMGLFRRLLGS